MKLLSFHKIPLIEIIIYLMIILLPLSNSDYLMNGIQTAKSFNFFYLVLALSLLWTTKILLFPKSRSLQITTIDVLLFIYILWVSINKYFIQETHCFSLKYFELLGLSLLYIILRTVNNKYYLYFILAICVSGTVQAIYGCLQLWGFSPSNHALFKMTGSFFNPGSFAGYLGGIPPIALGLYWMSSPSANVVVSYKNSETLSEKVLFNQSDKNLRQKLGNIFKKTLCNNWSNNMLTISHIRQKLIRIISITTIISILLVLPAARSRAAWLGAIVGIAYLAWHKYKIGKNLRQKNYQSITLFKQNYNIRNWIIYSIVTILIIGGSLSLYFYKKESANGRMLIWKVTTQIIKDDPSFGVGQDMFQAHYMNYQAEYFKNNPNSKYKTVAGENNFVFNELLQIFVENGVLFVLILILMLGLLLRKKTEINQHKKSQVPIVEDFNTLLRASLISVLFFGCFSYPSYILPIKILLLSIMATESGLTNYPIIWNISFQNKQKLSQRLIGFVMIVATVFPIKFLNNMKQAYIVWNNANDLYIYNEYKECILDYNKAFPVLANKGEFLLNYGKALSVGTKYFEAIEILRKSKNYLQNTITYTAMGDSYKELGENSKAEKAYLKACFMCPNRFYPQYRLGETINNVNQYLVFAYTALSNCEYSHVNFKKQNKYEQFKHHIYFMFTSIFFLF